MGRRRFRPRPAALQPTGHGTDEVEPQRLPGERQRLDALATLVETAGCRRAILLRHFGEDPPQTCGNCDNCIEAPGVVDASETARKLLSAVYRTGQTFGLGHIEKVLTGSGDARVIERGHDQLSVYGIVQGAEVELIRPLARALQARGALLSTEHGGLMLGGDARAILKGEDAVFVVVPPRREKTRRTRGGAGGSAANPVGDPLFDALRNLRRELAQQAGVPPYVVFHDSVLRDMAATRPQSLPELGQIGGIGDRKLAAYGEAFLAIIRQH